MIYLFNRRDVGVTMDFRQLSAMQDTLIAAGIFHRVCSKVQSASLATANSLTKAPHLYTYYIYVHKKDFEQACHALRSARN